MNSAYPLYLSPDLHRYPLNYSYLQHGSLYNAWFFISYLLSVLLALLYSG